MTKVVHITSAHPPFDKRIFVKECCSLAKAGYEVVFIAPHDREETVDGVTIRPFPKPQNRRERFIRSLWSAFKQAHNENADLYHLHDPDLLLTGFMLKLSGKKVIYDPHEDHPQDVLIKHWIARPLRSILSVCLTYFEYLSGCFFDAITPATSNIASRFPKSKTTVIHNFARIDEFNIDMNKCVKREQVLVSAGIISRERGIVETLKSYEYLREIYPNIELVLAGNFPTFDEEIFVRSLPGWSDTFYIGWLPRADLVNLLHKASIGLAVLHSGPTHPTSLPVKLFEYMAAKLPVVASNFPLWKEIVEKNHCGVTVDPLDVNAIVEGIRSILDTPDRIAIMGRNGYEAVCRSYNWENEEKKLLEVYKKNLT